MNVVHLIQVVCGRPSGCLQFSGGGLKVAIPFRFEDGILVCTKNDVGQPAVLAATMQHGDATS